MTESELLSRLARVEALHAGAATPGERDAAAQARDRIRARLATLEQSDPPVEFSFSLPDPWSRQLFISMLRRYGIQPYRYPRQRRTTLRAKIPRRFLYETLWPTFRDASRLLQDHLSEVARRVIDEAVASDRTDVEERPGSPAAIEEISGPVD